MQSFGTGTPHKGVVNITGSTPTSVKPGSYQTPPVNYAPTEQYSAVGPIGSVKSVPEQRDYAVPRCEEGENDPSMKED